MSLWQISSPRRVLPLPSRCRTFSRRRSLLGTVQPFLNDLPYIRLKVGASMASATKHFSAPNLLTLSSSTACPAFQLRSAAVPSSGVAAAFLSCACGAMHHKSAASRHTVRAFMPFGGAKRLVFMRLGLALMRQGQCKVTKTRWFPDGKRPGFASQTGGLGVVNAMFAERKRAVCGTLPSAPAVLTPASGGPRPWFPAVKVLRKVCQFKDLY